ncbi:unnamed protein product, partial [Adineta steineri]
MSTTVFTLLLLLLVGSRANGKPLLFLPEHMLPPPGITFTWAYDLVMGAMRLPSKYTVQAILASDLTTIIGYRNLFESEYGITYKVAFTNGTYYQANIDLNTRECVNIRFLTANCAGWSNVEMERYDNKCQTHPVSFEIITHETLTAYSSTTDPKRPIIVMAQSPLDTPADHDREKPNHMIFWLDASIGNPKEYTHLKKAFGSNTDPRCETWTMLNDEDYHNILVEDDAVTVSFEGVQFLLQAFDNEKDCLKAFEANQDKHIFFITSGKLGEHTVPKVIEQYRNIFTDLINNKPYSSIYVYCHNIEFQLEWTMDYLDYIQVFNFDADLLQRMTRDIAEYFIERCKRLRQANDIEGALQRLYWAKRLWR